MRLRSPWPFGPLVVLAAAWMVVVAWPTRGQDAPAPPPVDDTAPDAGPRSLDARVPALAASLIADAQAQAHASKSARCEACHTEDGWLPARFVHDRTGFPLTGRHEGADCVSCHRGDFSTLPSTSCSGCHRDVHAQSFGTRCAGCHTPATWMTTMDVSAHLSTNFPLTGRHGALLCSECHGDRRDRGFRQPVNDCASCHRPQYERAGVFTVDHRASRLSLDCNACHQPTRFRPASLPMHGVCYPLVGTAHHQVTCTQCHQSLAGTVANGTCQTQNQTCRECHAHQEQPMAGRHTDVEGYEWASLKCVGCHATR